MGNKQHEFTLKRDEDRNLWYVVPEKVVVKPGDSVVIRAEPDPRNWWVRFDPGAEPRLPAGESGMVIEILDHPGRPNENQTVLSYKFTVWIDEQYIDPEIVVDPPW